jgi:hypothetical protein
LSIIQGPFSVAPCQTLISRFATFASPYNFYIACTSAAYLLGRGPELVGDLVGALLQLVPAGHDAREQRLVRRVHGRVQQHLGIDCVLVNGSFIDTLTDSTGNALLEAAARPRS